MFAAKHLAEFAQQTSARTPTPGGGSSAAYIGALGAALGAMAARFSEGRKGLEDHAQALAHEIATLDDVRGRLLKLVDDDAEAYAQVKTAYALPKDERFEHVQAALRAAMEPPLSVCHLCVTAMGALESLRHHVNKNLASDVAVGAYALGAAYHSAWVNVLINLGGIKDTHTREKVLAQGKEISEAIDHLEMDIAGRIVADLRQKVES